MSRNLKIAINGFGRIGRCIFRAIFEQNLNIDIVAIIEPANIDAIAYLSKFDSTHGVFPGSIRHENGYLYVNDKKIQVFHTHKPNQVNWQALGIDLLLECSGQYSSRNEIQQFQAAGCNKILLSNPAKGAKETDCTIVYGVNEASLSASHSIVSAASCTTNAIVPVLNLLQQNYGVASAFMTSLHSVMNDQPIIDGYHNSDLRKTRSAMQSMVPIGTGLAHGVERILPELKGLTQAKSVRVPIVNVSAIDLSVNICTATSNADLISLFTKAAKLQPELFACVQQAYASNDFIHDSHSSIIDISQIRVNQGKFINLLVWFDNEWGFANRMLDLATYWARSYILGK